MPGLDLNVNITTGGYSLKNASFDESGTLFDLKEEKPQVRVALKDVDFTFSFNYNITTTPELI